MCVQITSYKKWITLMTCDAATNQQYQKKKMNWWRFAQTINCTCLLQTVKVMKVIKQIYDSKTYICQAASVSHDMERNNDNVKRTTHQRNSMPENSPVCFRQCRWWKQSRIHSIVNFPICFRQYGNKIMAIASNLHNAYAQHCSNTATKIISD